MKKLFDTSWILIGVLTLICSLGLIPSIKGQSASRKKMIEEMNQKMKELESSFDKLSNQLKSTEINLYSIGDKLNLVLNNVEVIKMRSQMVEEKVDSMETKLNSALDVVRVNQQHLSNGSMGTIGVTLNDHARRQEAAEAGLAKIMNVLTDLYGLAKESHAKESKSRSSFDQNDSIHGETHLRKIVREEVNILKHELILDMNVTGLTGRVNEMFSLMANIQENSCSPGKPRNDEDSSQLTKHQSHGNRLVEGEMCSDFSRLRNQFSFAIQELRNNMTLVMASIHNNSRPRAAEILTGKDLTATHYTPPVVNQADSPGQPYPHALHQPITTTTCPIMDPRVSSKTDCSQMRPSFPADCAEIIKSNSTCGSKVYAVRTGSPLRVHRVYCDMSDSRGGWTVIMRRGKFSEKRHHVDFRTNWQTYKRGFGDMNDEFWIGNDLIHHLTTKEPQLLQIDLKTFSNECIALRFKTFVVASEEERYRLTIGDPFGDNIETAETFLSLNRSLFVTSDSVQDKYDCSRYLTGGWWVKPSRCPLILLTGLYKEEEVRREVDSGIRWMSFKENESLKEVQMKIRPLTFANEV